MQILSRSDRAFGSLPVSPPGLARLWKMVALRRERRDLARLSDDQLHDIGVSRTEAEDEARRPIWDAPGHWHS